MTKKKNKQTVNHHYRKNVGEVIINIDSWLWCALLLCHYDVCTILMDLALVISPHGAFKTELNTKSEPQGPIYHHILLIFWKYIPELWEVLVCIKVDFKRGCS